MSDDHESNNNDKPLKKNRALSRYLNDMDKYDKYSDSGSFVKMGSLVKSKMDAEDALIAKVDRDLMEEKIYKELVPVLAEILKAGDVNAFFKKAGVLGAAKMLDLLQNSKSEKIQADMAKEITNRGFGKPVERRMNTNMNIEALDVSELDSMIESFQRKLDMDQKKIISEIDAEQKIVEIENE